MLESRCSLLSVTFLLYLRSGSSVSEAAVRLWIDSRPEGTPIFVGDTIHLFCSSNPSEWQKNKVRIDSSSKASVTHDGSGLILKSVTLDDAGLYSCWSQQYKLGETDIAVENAPKITSTKKVVKTVVGDHLELHCTAIHKMKVKWLKEGKIIQSRDGYLAENQNNGVDRLLHIFKVAARDNGSFTCEGAAYGFPSSDNISVEVRFPAEITVRPKNQTVVVYKPVKFNCQAKGYPKPTITWYKRSQQFVRTILKKGNDFTISIVNANDAGMYICKATNEIGKEEAEIYLSVTDPVAVMEQCVPGVEKTLNCDFAKHARIIATWTKDGEGVKSLNESHYEVRQFAFQSRNSETSHLTIKSCRHEDKGLYRCIVMNDSKIVIEVKITNLTVLDYPFPPGNLELAVSLINYLLRATWSPPPLEIGRDRAAKIYNTSVTLYNLLQKNISFVGNWSLREASMNITLKGFGNLLCTVYAVDVQSVNDYGVSPFIRRVGLIDTSCPYSLPKINFNPSIVFLVEMRKVDCSCTQQGKRRQKSKRIVKVAKRLFLRQEELGLKIIAPITDDEILTPQLHLLLKGNSTLTTYELLQPLVNQKKDKRKFRTKVGKCRYVINFECVQIGISNYFACGNGKYSSGNWKIRQETLIGRVD